MEAAHSFMMRGRSRGFQKEWLPRVTEVTRYFFVQKWPEEKGMQSHDICGVTEKNERSVERRSI